LTAYNYQNGKVNQFDSIDIRLEVASDYYDDSFSEFSFSMPGPFYGEALLFLIDNEISFQEKETPSYQYSIYSYHEVININQIDYYKVIGIENNYPLHDKLPYYYSTLYYNEEFGIIQITRSDGMVYDLVENK
jgi:hypothetical protein